MKFVKMLRIAALLSAGMAPAAFAGDVAAPFPVRELALPALGDTQQHHLTATADGRLIVSWVEQDGRGSAVRFAVYGNHAWSAVRTVARVDGKLGDPPVVLGLSDGSLAAAWMPYIKAAKSKFAADIYLVRSTDGGLTWSRPVKPYGTAARIYDAQMSLVPLPDAGLALVWTDMRDAGGVEEVKQDHRYQLMATIVGKDGQAGQEIVLDDDVCSCCRAYTAVSGSELLTVYRNHAAGEIRDIAAVRWRPDGRAQSVYVHDDHWHIEGCPSNGPSVDTVAGQTVAGWFSAADGNGRVKIGYSDDGGQHFARPIEVDAGASGYVNVLLLDTGESLVSWRGRQGPEDELRVAQVAPDGTISRRTAVYRGAFAKWPSKYPALVKAGRQAFIAWTDPDRKQVRLAALALE
jgi:hypothetical protein